MEITCLINHILILLFSAIGTFGKISVFNYKTITQYVITKIGWRLINGFIFVYTIYEILSKSTL